MKVLAVSGGPDSMYLLNEYKKSKVVVAHVNYNAREDSKVDEQIVRNFCTEHNLPLEVLEVKEKAKGNFQDWARKIRYDFFTEVAKKYNAKEVLVAHHKDDFVETAMMQQVSGREPSFFGIRKRSTYGELNIYRPYVNIYWKDDLVSYLDKKNIRYAIDSTNATDKYTRNQFRHELEKDPKKKKDLYAWFVMSNKILKKKYSKVSYLSKKWSKSNYSVEFFKSFKYKEEILYETLHNIFGDIKVSSNKLNSLIAFIESRDGGKEFKVSDKKIITKKKNHVIFIFK